MSTWLYLRCMDHNPPLEAENESGQHLYDLPQIRADLANREAVIAELAETHWAGDHSDAGLRDYFRRHTAKFLAKHPECRIGIWDEYGTEHTTEGDTP